MEIDVNAQFVNAVRNNGHLCNEGNEDNGNINNGECCPCFNDCGCCGIVVKFILIFPLFLLVFCFFLLKYLLILPFVVLFCIFAGITGYTCELICETDECCCSFLMIVFLPITMLFGIGLAFM